MKKLIWSIVILLLSCFVLVSCGKGNENSPYYATVLRQKIASQEKKCAGLAAGGLPDEEELAYLDALRRKETETLD